MSETIPTKEPDRFAKGDSVTWKIYLANYRPDDGWTLTYSFQNAAYHVSIEASDNGDGSHLVEIDTTASDLFTGDKTYKWQAKVTDGTDIRTVRYGRVNVLLDYSVDADTDVRSHVEKCFDLLKSVIEGKVARDNQSYSIEGRALSHYTWEEIERLYEKYKSRVAREHRKELRKLKRRHSGTVIMRL